MTKCKMCGMCCQVILLSVNSQIIARTARGETKDSCFNFAYRNFSEITREEAYNINPHLKNWNQENQFFYKCRQYDPISKKCNVHSIRPETCSGFPWYDREPYKQALYSKTCAFQKDIKKL